MTRKARYPHVPLEALRNPVGRAVLQRTIANEMATILRQAQMHAWVGQNPPRLINDAGRLVYVVLGAASASGWTTEHPDVRIMLGMSEALGDLQADGDIERHRGAIQSGLLAAERLLPAMNALLMLQSAFELDAMLGGTAGMGTADVQKLFPAAAPQ